MSFQGHTDRIGAIAFAPDGKTLATGGYDRTVRLWDVATGQERMTLKCHTTPVLGVAFAADGTILATGSEDGTVRLWRAATDEEASRLRPESDGGDPESAATQNDAADRLWGIGKPHDAEKAYLVVLSRLKKLADSSADVPDYRQQMAHTWFSMSLLLSNTGRPEEAKRAYYNAKELHRNLPVDYQWQLAHSYYLLGNMLLAVGHTQEAEKAYGEATELAGCVFVLVRPWIHYTRHGPGHLAPYESD